jgi:hypothetical protein
MVMLLATLPCLAQKDTIILKNKDMIVGEVKSLDRGVLVIETSYSDADFKVEWDGVKEIYTTSSFLLTHRSGKRVYSNLRSNTGSDSVKLMDEGQVLFYSLKDIVYLKGIKSKFWSRVDASIDVGLTLAKANNLSQYNINARVGYTANKWQLAVSYTDNRSSQDSIKATKRTETNVEYKYFLPHDWYLNTSLNLLSNTEQALNLRTTGKLGAGKYVIHTNQKYWGLGSGFSLISESFTNEKASQTSSEVYLASELNLFDMKDLSLFNSVFVYKSLSDSKRWRSDIKFDLKYDLPYDFYIKPGFTLNYDNRPAVIGKEVDYVITFSFGWEL